MNSATKLKERVKTHKWVRIYLVLAIIQAAIAISLMIPIFLNSQRISELFLAHPEGEISELFRRFKMQLESMIYFIFEIWRICMVIDAVLQMNSLTIYATAAATLFSFLLTISVLVEYFKILQDDPPEIVGLSLLNRNMQLSFSCIIFVLVIPTIWVATKVEREFGWGVYKKLGGSVRLQRMYKTVQCLSLMIKVDIFFEVVFMAFLVSEIIEELYHGLAIAVVVILGLSLVVMRESIARESHLLMALFIGIQILYMTTATLILALEDADGYSTIKLFFLDWYALSIYYVFGMLAGVSTIFFCVCCQINFGRGLKDYVQWSFYGLKTSKSVKANEEKINKANEKDKEAIAPIDIE